MALLVVEHKDPRPWIARATVTSKYSLDIHVKKTDNNRTSVTMVQGVNSLRFPVSDVDDLIEALKLIKERGV